MAMYLEGRVFIPVGRLSLSGFDEKSEAVRMREAGTLPTEKAGQEKKEFVDYIRVHVTCLEL